MHQNDHLRGMLAGVDAGPGREKAAGAFASTRMLAAREPRASSLKS